MLAIAWRIYLLSIHVTLSNFEHRLCLLNLLCHFVNKLLATTTNLNRKVLERFPANSHFRCFAVNLTPHSFDRLFYRIDHCPQQIYFYFILQVFWLNFLSIQTNFKLEHCIPFLLHITSAITGGNGAQRNSCPCACHGVRPSWV